MNVHFEFHNNVNYFNHRGVAKKTALIHVDISCQRGLYKENRDSLVKRVLEELLAENY